MKLSSLVGCVRIPEFFETDRLRNYFISTSLRAAVLSQGLNSSNCFFFRVVFEISPVEAGCRLTQQEISVTYMEDTDMAETGRLAATLGKLNGLLSSHATRLRERHEEPRGLSVPSKKWLERSPEEYAVVRPVVELSELVRSWVVILTGEHEGDRDEQG